MGKQVNVSAARSRVKLLKALVLPSTYLKFRVSVTWSTTAMSTPAHHPQDFSFIQGLQLHRILLNSYHREHDQESHVRGQVGAKISEAGSTTKMLRLPCKDLRR